MRQRWCLAAAAGLGMLVLGVAGCEKKTEESAPAPVSSLMDSERPAPDYDLSAEPLEAQYGGQIVALSVEGMTCNVCANKVGKALIASEGVWFGRVALEAKTAWVEVDPAQAPEPATLIAAITEAGFTASPFGEAPALPADVPAGEVDEG
ncbi:MAG: heavy-metal-associated domain-containing protein [Phycisphaerales bacterium JB039]